jgi:hypothetical protein
MVCSIGRCGLWRTRMLRKSDWDSLAPLHLPAMPRRPGPVLREVGNGTGGSARPRSPFAMPTRTEVPLAAPTPSRAARVRQDARPIRHSVGGKDANGQISRVRFKTSCNQRSGSDLAAAQIAHSNINRIRGIDSAVLRDAAFRPRLCIDRPCVVRRFRSASDFVVRDQTDVGVVIVA